MKSALTYTFFSLLMLLPFSANAGVKIVECLDADGNRTFQKTCPPGTTEVSAKSFSTGGSAGNENKVSISATLYVIPECDSCEEVKDFLSARNVSITEKDVEGNLELQNELTDIAGGLKVPTTIIGDEVLTGYSRSSFLEALEKAGYREDEES